METPAHIREDKNEIFFLSLQSKCQCLLPAPQSLQDTDKERKIFNKFQSGKQCKHESSKMELSDEF
jgi:hypothetical protein